MGLKKQKSASSSSNIRVIEKKVKQRVTLAEIECQEEIESRINSIGNEIQTMMDGKKNINENIGQLNSRIDRVLDECIDKINAKKVELKMIVERDFKEIEKDLNSQITIESALQEKWMNLKGIYQDKLISDKKLNAKTRTLKFKEMVDELKRDEIPGAGMFLFFFIL